MTAKSDSKDSNDAVAMLMSDHRKVEKVFADFEKLKSEDATGKKKLVDKISKELLVHMTLEEEIFYPAVAEEVKGAKGVVKEGIVEHAGAKDLIKQLKAMKGDESLFDAKVKVLSEQIEHHVKEEEDEMFPKVKKSSLDLAALGKEMATMKAGL
ncbi:MAG: hemerythrin domain-containing protein [Pseudohongiella sp.]|uniref:hemerythrin domain-containing protein n=1 Tax=Pseudohongiella sp. TaxID=1979412 RepID=UPI00349FDAE4